MLNIFKRSKDMESPLYIDMIISEFHSIESVIDSCENIEQLMSAGNMIGAFKKRWMHRGQILIPTAFSMALERRMMKKLDSLEGS